MEGFPPPPPGGMADHEQMLEEKVRCDARFQHGCAVLILAISSTDHPSYALK